MNDLISRKLIWLN